MSGDKKKRQAYDNAFKMRVIEFAEREKNNCAVEKEFGVNEKLVRDWVKNKEEIYQGPVHQKRKVTKLRPFEDMEQDLLGWILQLRHNGMKVSRNMIRMKALQLAEITYGIDKSEFKASNGWCGRFMRRYGLHVCRQQQTRVNDISLQPPTDDDDFEVAMYNQFLEGDSKQLELDSDQIDNMKELPEFCHTPKNFSPSTSQNM